MSRLRPVVLVGTALFLLSMIAATVPAVATTRIGDGFTCLNGIGGSLTVDASTINQGQSVTVTWRVTTPDHTTCPGLFSQQLDGQFVAAQGATVRQPSQTHTFLLKGYYGVLNRVLATATVTVPEPQAQLPGLYGGTITSDFATTTGLTVEVTGPNTALSAAVTVDSGVRADCHGNQVLPHEFFTLTGRRTSVGPDGSSTYYFSGQFDFEAAVHVVVDVTVSDATLSADGQTFAGTAGLLIQPSIGANCTKSWPFTTTRVPSVTVPSVLEMPLAQARSTLTAAGLGSTATARLDRHCSTVPGTVMDQYPGPGAVVPLNTVVELVLAVWPPQCP